MAKRKSTAGRMRKTAAPRRDRRRAIIILGLVLSLASAGGILAQWRALRSAPKPTATIAQVSPLSLSKEYIYAGDRLVATRDDEPPIVPGEQRSFLGSPFIIPGTIQVEHFDNGGEGVAYHDDSPGNEVGTYRHPTDVDVWDGGIGYVKAGEWLEYTVNVSATGTYTVRASVGTPAGGGTFHIEIGGMDRTGPMVIPGTGGWHNYQIVSRTNVNLSAGPHVMRIVMDSNGPNGYLANFDYIRIVESQPPSTTYTVTASPSIVAPNAQITVSWTAPSGSDVNDWIGLYRVGDPDDVMVEWQVTGGATSGSMSFTAPSETGQYDLRYFVAGTFTKVATSNIVAVSADAFTITASPSVVGPGDQITVNWVAPAGRPWNDWIGFYVVGNPDDLMIEWRYTNGVASGSMTFTAPAQVGQYNFRYFLEDGFTRVAQSNTVTVQF